VPPRSGRDFGADTEPACPTFRSGLWRGSHVRFGSASCFGSCLVGPCLVGDCSACWLVAGGGVGLFGGSGCCGCWWGFGAGAGAGGYCVHQ